MNEPSPPEEAVTAALVVIGDEILSGRTKDRNIGYVADYLTRVGIRLLEVRIVPDVEPAIVEAVNALRSRYTYVITTGGIGPTHDDITANAIARAFGVGIDIDQRAVAELQQRFDANALTPARLRMARIPEGAELIHNPVSRAPGFMLQNVMVMAGVPMIMQAMLDSIAPSLRKGRPMLSRSIRVESPEGEVSDTFAEMQKQHPQVAMGSYPFFEKQRLGTNLVLRSVDAGLLGRAADALEQALRGGGFAVIEQSSLSRNESPSPQRGEGWGGGTLPDR